ncbi:hypothetical protein BD770DRAFT_4816 [Pilaira anomala]|nr:hypothetical protein BD770DRAFT_4816 [Pilaira anomala]
MLKKEGFQVYLLNEYKTSSVCPTCTSSSLETFKKCKNPRPYQRSKNPIVNCHGPLRCTNQQCLESVSNNNGNNFRVWNRDLAAVLNFATIVKQLRKTMTRPDVFKRKNFEDSSAKKKRLVYSNFPSELTLRIHKILSNRYFFFHTKNNS